MKKARHKPKNVTVELKQYRKNEEIRSEQVRLIDPDTGINDVFSLAKALEIAENEGLDLVEVSPNTNPPVVKLINYDSFRYQQKKMMSKQKNATKTLETKGMRLSPRIDDNDLLTKVKQGIKFLEKGHKIKIDVSLKGRENQHANLAIEVVKRYIDKISESVNINIDQSPQKIGRMINAMISKKA